MISAISPCIIVYVGVVSEINSKQCVCSLNKLTQSASYRSLLKLKYRCITFRGLGFRIGANQGGNTMFYTYHNVLHFTAFKI